MDVTAPYKQEKEHRPRHSHTTHIICIGFFTLLSRFRISLPGMQPWAIYFIETTQLYFSGLTVLQTGTASLKSHSNTISPEQTCFKSSPSFITEERHLEVVSRVTVTSHTGHHGLSVIQPQPNLSSSSNPW